MTQPAWCLNLMDEKKVLDRLQRLCARAEYCSFDISRKALKSLEDDEKAAARVVASLVKDRYVDDARYAMAFAREKSSLQGWGPVKIRYYLRMKGITGAIADEAIAEANTEENALARMEKLLSAKARTLKGDPNAKPKLLRYAIGRGYTYDQAAPVVEKLLK